MKKYQINIYKNDDLLRSIQLDHEYENEALASREAENIADKECTEGQDWTLTEIKSKKQYYFIDSYNKRHYITGKAGSWQWINFDQPTLYKNINGKTIVNGVLVDYVTTKEAITIHFPSYHINIWADDEAEAELLENFVDLCDRAFHTHFKNKEWAGEYTGHLRERISTYY